MFLTSILVANEYPVLPLATIIPGGGYFRLIGTQGTSKYSGKIIGTPSTKSETLAS
jgi:hypothetical protein